MTKKSGQKAVVADIGFLGMLRWAWRQLTTMRVALILLLILAMAAIPGSLLPQNVQDPSRVTAFIEENGAWGQFLDALQLFDVYSSVWFSAIYILLMISLVGCVIPRTAQHYRAMKSPPPRPPRRFERMPGFAEFSLAESSPTPAAEAGAGNGAAASAAEPAGSDAAASMLDRAEKALKKSGYRTRRFGSAVAAERGYLRETGNLLFHACLLLVVVTMAVGSSIGYAGQRILVEGETFTNSLVSYDSFEPGRFFQADSLVNYRLTLDEFESSFDSESTGSQFGQPRQFTAHMTETKDGVETEHVLEPNKPIRVDGSRVYLTGNGYAPIVTTKDADGDVTYSGPVVFLPEDGTYTSRGVVKVPDADPQLGFSAVLLPTAAQNEDGELVSDFAELLNPLLVMNAFVGDLGLDAGVAQSVYELDASSMEPLVGADGQPLTLQMTEGQTETLPDGMGTISYDGTAQYISMDVRYDPTQGLMLVFSVLLIVGLGLSLFVPRRRMWVRVDGEKVEVAALARGEDPRVEKAAEDLALELKKPARDAAASRRP